MTDTPTISAKPITKCSECNIRLFMECLYDKDTTGLNGGDFEAIFTEYIDLSGIGETREFDLLTQMHNIQTRMIFISNMLHIQRRFFLEFSIPFVDAFKDLYKFGHYLKWDPENPVDFLKQLERVEIIEKKSQAELDKVEKDLKTLKKDGVKSSSEMNGRIEFVRQLNALNKEGYKIDRDKTDMEELALMIRDYNQMVREQMAAIEKQKNPF